MYELIESMASSIVCELQTSLYSVQFTFAKANELEFYRRFIQFYIGCMWKAE